jgi:hypothetical protein
MDTHGDSHSLLISKDYINVVNGEPAKYILNNQTIVRIMIID